MRPLARQVGSFALIGAGGTGAYLLLFVGLHPLGAQAASLLARVLTAVPTAWLNARLTFRSRVPLRRACAAGLGGLALGAGLSAVALAALDAASTRPSRALEVCTLAATQVGAAALRFLLLRSISEPFTGHSQPALMRREGSVGTVTSIGDDRLLASAEDPHDHPSHPSPGARSAGLGAGPAPARAAALQHAGGPGR